MLTQTSAFLKGKFLPVISRLIPYLTFVGTEGAMDGDLGGKPRQAFNMLWESVLSANNSNDHTYVHTRSGLDFTYYQYLTRTSLQNADANLKTLALLLAVFQDVAEIETSKIRRQRNALLSISKLPLEISGVIFENLINDANDRPTCISTLSLVSSVWKNLVDTTPSLWSQLRPEYSSKFIRSALDKSRGHPITIHGQFKQSEPSVARQQAILATCSQLTRWSSADVESETSAELDILTYSGAPKLRRLEVACLGRPDDAQRPINLCDGHAPRLEHLSITRFKAVWSSSIFTGLSILTLRQVPGLQSRDLMQILHACPGLRTLNLLGVHLTDQLQSRIGESRRIDLLNLKHLDIRTSSFDCSQYLLASIHCPAVTTLALTLPDFALNPPPPEISPSFQPVVLHAIRFLNKGAVTDGQKPPRVLFTQNHCILCVWSKDELYSLWFDGRGSGRGVVAMLDAMHQTWALPSLVKVVPPGQNSGWKLLAMKPSTTFLHLKDEAESVEYLGTPIQHAGTIFWPFPNLNNLRLERGTCRTPEEVVKMVQGRKGRLLVGPEVPTELPSPLECLTIGVECPMDGLTFMKLTAILPGAMVTWEGENGLD